MVTVIQTLLQAGKLYKVGTFSPNCWLTGVIFTGHKFAANELVNLVLEPGIWWVCSSLCLGFVWTGSPKPKSTQAPLSWSKHYFEWE